MKKTLFLSLITLISFLSVTVEARDRLRSVRGDIKFYRHGIATDVPKEEQGEFIKRVRIAFDRNKSDTSSLWYKNDFTRNGKTVEEQWNNIKSSSFISFLPQQRKRRHTPRTGSTSNRFDMQEIIIEIIENPNDIIFGRTMAKFPDGEIRGYDIPGEWLTPIYCVDIAGKYLPPHYSILTQKYSKPPYDELELDCITKDDKEG